MCLNIPFITISLCWEGNTPFSGNMLHLFSTQVNSEFTLSLKMAMQESIICQSFQVA